MGIARTFGVLGLAAVGGAGCNFNVPFDPANAFRPINGAIENAEQFVDNLVEDPLGGKPFPVIIGGDSDKVLYATNLGDVRLNFSGPTNDVVLPLFDGPSNLYSIENKQRDLVRPLAPTSYAWGLASDGISFAYMAGEDPFGLPVSLIADSLYFPSPTVVFQSQPEDGTSLIPELLALDEGRLAFVTFDDGTQSYTLHLEGLYSDDPGIEIETRSTTALDLDGTRLAYAGTDVDGVVRIHLRDLNADTDTTVAELHAEYAVWSLFLTENQVVWEETVDYQHSRIRSFDIPTGATRVWVDSVPGRLAGASDEYFVTEAFLERDNGAGFYTIRRYDAQAREKRLATFRADGLAGQTTVLGDRVVWVNPERRIIIAPLAGGNRLSFRPY